MEAASLFLVLLHSFLAETSPHGCWCGERHYNEAPSNSWQVAYTGLAWGGCPAEQLSMSAVMFLYTGDTLLLFGNSKAAATGQNPSVLTQPWRLPRAGPKGTSRESLGHFASVCAKDILGCDGKAQHHQVLGLGNKPIAHV